MSVDNTMLFIFCFSIFILFPNTAQAYIDPGMASLTLQIIIGSMAALLFTLRSSLKSYWMRFRLLFQRRLGSTHQKQDQEQNGEKKDDIAN